MRVCVLDGAEIKNRRQLYDALAEIWMLCMIALRT